MSVLVAFVVMLTGLRLAVHVPAVRVRLRHGPGR